MAAKFIIKRELSNGSFNQTDTRKYYWILSEKETIILKSDNNFNDEQEARDNIKLIKKSITKYTKVEKK